MTSAGHLNHDFSHADAFEDGDSLGVRQARRWMAVHAQNLVAYSMKESVISILVRPNIL